MPENLFDAAWKFFENNAWPHVATTENKVIQTLFPLTGTPQYDGYLHVLADHRQLVYYSVFPRHVPAHRRTAAQEIATRANTDLIYGNVELNLDHGGVRFRTSLVLGDAAFDPKLLRPLMAGNATGLFRYHPCFDAVIDTACTPAEALRHAI